MNANESESSQGASYPYVALSTALVIAEAVKQLGGNKTPVPKSLLASSLKENEKGQGFTFKIASAKCFDMIEGKSAYTLTESAKRYFFPTSSLDKIEASLHFFNSPSGFADIIKRFDGQQLPETKMLANMFHTQLRVPESWSVRAATFFVRGAQTVGAIDEHGFLRFNAAKHGAKAINDGRSSLNSAETQELKPPAGGSEQSELTTSDGYHCYDLPLNGNRKVTIKAPLDISPVEIKRLTKWIEFTLQIDWSGEDKI